MNERIRELKHLASVWCDENIPEQYSEETNGYGKAWEDKFAELIVRECGYYADVFSALECPVDMDPTETKPSDYIKREMGIAE